MQEGKGSSAVTLLRKEIVREYLCNCGNSLVQLASYYINARCMPCPDAIGRQLLGNFDWGRGKHDRGGDRGAGIDRRPGAA